MSALSPERGRGASADVDARRALLEHLIDHAALFPPANLSMDAALAVDRDARRSADSWVLGRFLCPASRLAELARAAAPDDRLRLGVVLDGATASSPADWLAAVKNDLGLVRSFERAAGERLAVEVLEVRLPETAPPLELVAHLGELVEVPAFLELRLEDDWHESVPRAISAIAGGGDVSGAPLGAKVRCGGATPAAFPSPEQLAATITACRRSGVLLKATAGLHHPIRHLDRTTGARAHGFLNLLAASVFAHALDLPEDELARVLAEEDSERFTVSEQSLSLNGRSVAASGIAETRRQLFVGYGSCSFAEPMEDLKALGVLPL